MTTFDPGASLVLTQGWDRRPRSTAFFASRPAAIITEGLDVLVQLVMAAITTDPCRSWCTSPPRVRPTWVRRWGVAWSAVAVLPPSPSHRPPLPGGAGGAM